MRAQRLLAVLIPALLLQACGPAYIDWQNHLTLRSAGVGQKSVTLSHVEPNEVVTNAISRDLHYVSIALDSVFFRNLPGIFSGATVVFGFEIQGVLPGGKSIKTVFEPIKAVGENAFLSLDNVTVIQPFLYAGRNITITLYFQAVSEDESLNIAGRVQGAAGLLKKLNPMAGVAIDTARSIFTSILGAFRPREMRWKYSFTLYPADSVYRDKPEMLFLAGREIIVATPPTDAPASLRKLVSLRSLTSKLRLRGNRLVWKDTDEEYTATPYIILNITRYKRYPNDDTELRRLVRKVDSLYETGSYERALAELANVGAAIVDDPVITQNEKNLERAMMDYRRARIQAAMAKTQNDFVTLKSKNVKQIELLRGVLSEFKEILYPYEIKDYRFRIKRLTRANRELAS